MELTVSQTEPGVQGDRVSGARKPADLETGKTVQVPLFVEIGDRVKVDTRTGEYITRVRDLRRRRTDTGRGAPAPAAEPRSGRVRHYEAEAKGRSTPTRRSKDIARRCWRRRSSRPTS